MSISASPAQRRLTAVLLFVAAALSVVLPFASATLFTVGLGGVAIAAGVAQLLRLRGVEETRGKVFRALSGALYLLGGLSLFLFPVQSVVSLTLFIGFLLAFEGVMELAAAAAGSVAARGLVLLDGIVTTVLGGMLIAEWPSDSLWAIGTLLGIGLAFSGLNLLAAQAPAEGGVPAPGH